MSGLFGTLNISKRGMFVQQKAIDVTSHNIANANTEGYSRQRAKIETTRPFGMPSIHNVAEPGQLGTGAQISAIERIRDAFLDFQVRTELSTYSNYDTRYKFLYELESILNEPTDTGISSLMTEFYNSWNELAKHPESSYSRTVVAQKSKTLADALNHSYNQLNKLQSNAQELIKSNVFEINNILDQIDSLNQEIMAVKVAGKMPNDLMDKRDLLLDELSQKFNIEIDKKAYEGIDVKPGNDGLPMVKAIENEKDVYRLSYIDTIGEKQADGKVKITYYQFGNKESDKFKREIEVDKLTDDDIKSLNECRVLWTDKDGNIVGKDDKNAAVKDIVDKGGKTDKDKIMTACFKPKDGTLKGLMSIQNDVNSYIEQVNRLAKALAWSVNAIHTVGIDSADLNYRLFFVNKDAVADDTDINAGNITVNEDILKDVMLINAKKENASGESDNTRALAIAALKDTYLMIQDIGGTGGTAINSRDDLINKNGGFTADLMIKSNVAGIKMDGYFKDTVDRLGVQSQQAKKTVKNKLDLLDSFNESRMSVSGVSLDEEVANLIQFQHAYQANAKIISTVDELLDVVINGLKR